MSIRADLTTINSVQGNQLCLGDVIVTTKWDGTPQLVTVLTLQLLNDDVQIIGTDGFDCLVGRKYLWHVVRTQK